MPNRRIFILIDGNIRRVVREWHYGDFIPTFYYFYDVKEAARYKVIYEGKKFIWYIKE